MDRPSSPERSRRRWARLPLILAIVAAPWMAACGAGPAPAKTPDVAPSTSATADDRVVHARADLDRSEQSLDTSTSDCGTACKALASMERAQKALCEVAATDECDRAKERVDKAKAKVKGAGCACNG